MSEGDLNPHIGEISLNRGNHVVSILGRSRVSSSNSRKGVRSARFVMGRLKIGILCGGHIRRQRMGFSRQCGECHRYFCEIRADIGNRGAPVPAMAHVPSIGLCDCEAEVTFNPGECGVPEPVSADLLGCHPRKMPSQALPQVVIAP